MGTSTKISNKPTREAYEKLMGPNKNGLCYMGRIQYAMGLCSEARNNGGSIKVGSSNVSIKALEAKIVDIEKEWVQAQEEYWNIAMMSGEMFIDFVCECKYCSALVDVPGAKGAKSTPLQNAVMEVATSMLMRTLYEMYHPDYAKDDDTPNGLKLWKEKDYKRLGELHSRVLLAQHNYLEVCKRFNSRPSWGYLFRNVWGPKLDDYGVLNNG